MIPRAWAVTSRRSLNQRHESTFVQLERSLRFAFQDNCLAGKASTGTQTIETIVLRRRNLRYKLTAIRSRPNVLVRGQSTV